MLCRIADLLTEVPEADGLAVRCKEYMIESKDCADIIIRTELYAEKEYFSSITKDELAYLESGRQFCVRLLDFDGFYLHSSSVALDGKAYLFSGPCGMGKSTHSRLWKQYFGDDVQLFNDDKPALRYIDGTWYAYGTPWCGKDGINKNIKVPLAGICFLKQAPENRIRQLSKQEALSKILPQTIYRFSKVERINLLLNHLDKLLQQIPVFELENRPELEAVKLSYETMSHKAEEMGL